MAPKRAVRGATQRTGLARCLFAVVNGRSHFNSAVRFRQHLADLQQVIDVITLYRVEGTELLDAFSVRAVSNRTWSQ